MLAPRASRKFLSYVTGELSHKAISWQRFIDHLGWLTCAGWQASVATSGFFTGTLIQGMIVENNPTYNYQRWQGTFLTWAAILIAVIFNTVISRALPKIEGLILVLHVLGFIAVLIPLVYLAPYSSPSEVFTTFLDGGGWDSQGLSFFIGLVGNATAFIGKSSPSALLVTAKAKADVEKVPMERYM